MGKSGCKKRSELYVKYRTDKDLRAGYFEKVESFLTTQMPLACVTEHKHCPDGIFLSVWKINLVGGLFFETSRKELKGKMSKFSKLSVYGATFGLVLTLGVSSFAQNGTTPTNGTVAQTTSSRSIASGEKAKIKGVVVDRQADMLTVRDSATNQDVRVMLTGNTSIKSKKWFGSGKTFVADMLTRGLYLEAQGRGDGSGNLNAEKIRFGEDDLRAAQSLDARVTPVEGRVTAAEENAQRLSGQLDELVAISNAARGGAKAAQETADAAVQGVNATNQRITELDDYAVQDTATVNFRTGSAVLSPESKAKLDEVATGVSSMKGYVMEVTGYADATGNTNRNRALSQRRAEAVISYLVENHGIPLRRILPSYGFGEAEKMAVGDNTTRDGRAQNRRVEVKLLVSKGLTNSVEVQMPNQTTTDPQQ